MHPTPRGGRDAVQGLATVRDIACLGVLVAAPPVDDAANAALIAWLAGHRGLPTSAVGILSGEQGRLKRLRIEADDAAARLSRLVEAVRIGNAPAGLPAGAS